MKKVLLFVGLGAAGYYAYRVARLADALKQPMNIPGAGVAPGAKDPWTQAAISQASIGLLAGAALLAWKVL